MIKSVQLKNFQPYQDAKINFHPGVNVITGQSNAGKSALVRAIVWGLQNVPRGDSFHSHHATDNETAVKIYFDDNVVERIRSNSRNDYVVGSDIYTALRTGVPDEVLEATKMGELNIQKQHDAYFLFQLTPGQIAIKINSIVGLEVMDKVLTTINQMVNETKREVTEGEQKEKQLVKELASFDWVDEAEQAIISIETDQSAVNEINEHCEKVKASVKQARGLEQERQQCKDFLSIEFAYDTLVREHEELVDLSNSCLELNSLIDQVKVLNYTLSKCNSYISIEPLYDELIKDHAALSKAVTSNLNLREDVTRASRLLSEHVVCTTFLSIEPEYQVVVTDYEMFNKFASSNLQFSDDCKKARILKKEVQGIRKTVRQCEPEVNELLQLEVQLNEYVSTCAILHPLVGSGRKLQKQHNNISKQESDYDTSFHQLLGENEQCPVCGQVIHM